MKPVRALIFVAVASLFGFASPSLLAHGGENHDTQKATNGGQLRTAGLYNIELVVAKDNREATDSPIVIHVTDHAGAKVPTVGATGTATILAGKQKATAMLVADGDNRLKGTAKYPSAPDMKVVVSISFPGKAAEQARFTPLAATKDEHTEHQH
ncbi:MAG: hypothetical protein NT159_21795 [Proteobacteria bacterium]|nr:hypothetical protein [Pseudomonadota bacterium]